jgi:hypothetical protein
MFVSCVYMLCCPVKAQASATRPEESYRVSSSVWIRNLKGGGQGPIWAVEPLDWWNGRITLIKMPFVTQQIALCMQYKELLLVLVAV